MPINRKQLRGTVLAEDARTERFFRSLLDHLGFDKRKFYFKTAPKGSGDAGAWVRAQYPSEVNLLRRKAYQRLCLVAVRDGDNEGVAVKKADLDAACPRHDGERIAIPVPTWSIETWLLVLLGDDQIDESKSMKLYFEHLYPGKAERNAITSAAEAWLSRGDNAVGCPSLEDGNIEILRLDLS